MGLMLTTGIYNRNERDERVFVYVTDENGTKYKRAFAQKGWVEVRGYDNIIIAKMSLLEQVKIVGLLVFSERDDAYHIEQE